MVQNNTFFRKLLISFGQVIICTAIVVWFIQSSSNGNKDVIVEKILKIKEEIAVPRKGNCFNILIIKNHF